MSQYFPDWLTKALNATRSMPKEESRPIVNSLFKKWRVALRAEGKCQCGRPATRGILCLDHAVKVREANERRAKRLIKEGRCPKCAAPLKPDRKRCAKCLHRDSVAASEMAAELVRLGLCIRCKSEIPAGRDAQTCESCVETNSDAVRRRCRDLVKEGRCARCREKNTTRPGKWRCRKCLDYENDGRRARKSSPP